MRNVLFVVFSLFLTACSHPPYQQIQLGMSKEDVARLVGRPYSVVSSKRADDKKIEVLEYHRNRYLPWWIDTDDPYWLYFTNNKLEKFGTDRQLRYLD